MGKSSPAQLKYVKEQDIATDSLFRQGQMSHFANDNSMNIFRLPVGWQYVFSILLLLNSVDFFPQSATLHASERDPKLPHYSPRSSLLRVQYEW